MKSADHTLKRSFQLQFHASHSPLVNSCVHTAAITSNDDHLQPDLSGHSHQFPAEGFSGSIGRIDVGDEFTSRHGQHWEVVHCLDHFSGASDLLVGTPSTSTSDGNLRLNTVSKQLASCKQAVSKLLASC